MKQQILDKLRKLTGHKYVALTQRGNKAIEAAMSASTGNILIPDEGGWLTYETLPSKLGLNTIRVNCEDSKIHVDDLQKKINENSSKDSAFIYHNPGGYFAEQPIKKIFDTCNKNGCPVIQDVSGSIGTNLCDGKYADIIVGSFGKWKPINAEKGGFISCNDKELFDKVTANIDELNDGSVFEIINNKLDGLQDRLKFLKENVSKVKNDLSDLQIVRPNDFSLVVIVKFTTDSKKENNKKNSHLDLSQREKIINYCKNNQLEWTECPRYIRVNKKAISIEVKRLEQISS